MKKLLYTIGLVLFVSISACESGSKAPAASSPGTGDWSSYEMTDLGEGLSLASKKDDKGQLLEEGTLKNGKREGTWVTFHTKKGIPATMTSYAGGNKNGTFVKINDKGDFEEIAHFSNGALSGVRKVYDRTRVIEEASYLNGQLNGERKLFYKDGTSKEEGVFKNGKRDGTAKWFDEEGNVTIEMEYKNGEKVN